MDASALGSGSVKKVAAHHVQAIGIDGSAFVDDMRLIEGHA